MRNVQRVAHLGTWTWHLATNRLEWSDEMFRIFGVEQAGFDGDLAAVIARVIHPDDRAAVERTNRSVLEDGKPEPLEYRVRWPDGTTRVVWAEAAELLRDADGRPTILTGIVQDITDRKRAEEALRASEEKYSTVFASAPIAIVVSRLHEGTILEVNDTFTSMMGFTREEAVGSSGAALRIRVDDEQRAELIVAMCADGPTASRECQLRTKHGDIITALVSVRPIRIGAAECILSTLSDITNRKRTEVALHASQAKLAAALDSMTDAVFVADATGHLVDINEAFASFHRFPSKAECLRNLAEYPDLFELFFADGELAPFEMWPLARALRGEAGMSHEYTVRRKDTREAWISSYSFGPIRDASGAVVGAVGAVRDITDRKRAEQERAKLESQLQQAHGMESVGRLAGGVAHDFNNLLGVILGHTELALVQVEPSLPLHEDLQEIRRAARRSAELTRQLLGFARKQTVTPRLLDVNEAVTGMLTMLRRLIGENVDLDWRPSRDLWSVRVDPSQVDQILTSLCTNARAAIADIGTLSIETSNRTLDAEYCAAHVETVPGDYVRVVVRDDGCGMDRDTLARVFEPFFTTKPVGEGTGLGLATVYGIVRQNDGFIDVVSAPGAGSSFSVYLPRHLDGADAARRSVAPSALPAPARRGRETILLVEDEESVLRVTKKMLELSGYVVLTARLPRDALRIAQEQGAKLDMLVTDVVMPEMNGHDLAKAILAVAPTAKRLYMSGYAADVLAHGELQPGESFINKPFSLKDLAAKVREVLDG